MRTFATTIKLFLVQKYFTLISQSVTPSVLQEKQHESDDNPVSYPFFARIISLFYKKETVVMDRICTPETYGKDFYELRKIFFIYGVLLNEEIALFILRVVYTSYPCSGDWGYNSRKEKPDFVIRNALRYIRNDTVLDEIADRMITMHGAGEKPARIGGADAEWEKKQLTFSAILIYKETENRRQLLNCANYLWKEHFMECCYPKDIHFLLNLLLELNVHERQELVKNIQGHLISPKNNSNPSCRLFSEYYDEVIGDIGKKA